MNYQKLIIVGNATRDAEQQTSKKGNVTYTTFGVGVSREEKSTFFPVTVFGNQAEPVAKWVTKGKEVLVEGRIEVNDNGRFNVVAARVAFGAKPEKPTKKKK